MRLLRILGDASRCECRWVRGVVWCVRFVGGVEVRSASAVEVWCVSVLFCFVGGVECARWKCGV